MDSMYDIYNLDLDGQLMTDVEIWVDRETGVNYVFTSSVYAGGLTVLMDREGKPVISPLQRRDPE